MSSTKRGAERRLDDLYETPEWMTQAAVELVTTRLDHVKGPLNILEPAAGGGKMVKVLKEAWPDATIHAQDIRGTPSIDFLKQAPKAAYDLIITNPPFSRALEFIQHALKFRRDEQSVVAFILRLNFLGSRKRAQWLRDHQPAVHVSPKRPAFTDNGKTDSCEYAWFLWQEPFLETSEIGILSTELIQPKMQGFTGQEWSDIQQRVARRRREAVIPFD